MQEFRGIKVATQDGHLFKKDDLVAEFGPRMFQPYWYDHDGKSLVNL